MSSDSNPTPAWPDPKATDPRLMGWMKGTPPPPDKMARFADGSYMQFPRSRWSLSHLRELMPTASIWRAGQVRELPRAGGSMQSALSELTFTSMQGESMTWPESLMRTYFDGIVVLHRGAIVYEDYFGEGAPHRAHMLASVSKSFVGTLAAMLVHEGVLDAAAPVPTVLPELRSSAYANATIREVMDMLIGVVFSEDYADPTAGIWDFCRAGGVLPASPGYAGPRSFSEFMTTTRQEGPHNEAFAYKTINTQVLSWIIERSTGMPLAEVIATKLWSRLGMENDAYISIDSTGTGFGGGGMSTTLRDLARFGEMMRNGGACGAEQVVPEAVVADIRGGGDPAKFHRAEIFRPTLPGWSYRNMWWVSHNAHGAYQARGVHGQCIYVDPAAEMVIARFGSHPVASGIANDPITLPGFMAVAKTLMASTR